jgi:hypothetical protein
LAGVAALVGAKESKSPKGLPPNGSELALCAEAGAGALEDAKGSLEPKPNTELLLLLLCAGAGLPNGSLKMMAI